MKVVFESAYEMKPHVWSVEAAPQQLAALGAPKGKTGPRSILLVEDATLDAGGHLWVDPALATLLNLGTSSEAIIIGFDAAGTRMEPPTIAGAGPGDRKFLSLVQRELMGEAKDAAEQLLAAIRQKQPGDLKKGERNNFSETPDNFWYVIVQPRNQALSITVRGRPDRFGASSLGLKDDRPGYTRFQVRSIADVQEAIRIIEASRRR